MSLVLLTDRSPILKLRSASVTEHFRKQIKYIDYNEARRLRDPIYKVLITELYEEGCTMAADYFTCLVVKERELISKLIIKELVKNEPDLLMKLYTKVKLAEKAAKLSEGAGMVACLQLLFQSLKLLETYEERFDWLLSDLYDLFVEIARKQDNKCAEIKARMFCSYAIYFAGKVKMAECLEYFSMALELCRGTLWPAQMQLTTETEPMQQYGKSLHVYVAVSLANTMLACGRSFIHTDPVSGLNMTQTALLAIAEVNLPENTVLLCNTYIIKIDLLIELRRFKTAMINIGRVEQRINPDLGDDYMRLKCDVLSQKGQCFKFLLEYEKALPLFQESLSISQKYNFKRREGYAQLHLGQIYMQHPDGKQKAITSFTESKRIFTQLKDKFNTRMAVFALARLHVNTFFPTFVDLIKSTDIPCGMQSLRKWKYLCCPAWHEPTMENSHIVYKVEHDWTEHGTNITQEQNAVCMLKRK